MALDALKRADLLDTPPEARFDRITRLLGDVLGVPVCLVSLIDSERQFFKSATGLPEPWASRRETPLSHSFCRHVVDTAAPLIVTDASADDRVIDNHAVKELGVIAYLGVPIHIDGIVVGALCAIDHEPREWTAREVDRITDFAAIIDGEIELRLLAREREEARRDAELLAGEAAHRAKNSLTVAASLISLSLAEAKSADDLARLARERIMALSVVQDVLRGEEDGELGGLLSRVLGPYIGEGAGRSIRIDGAPFRVPQEKITPIGLIFHELATNACKHGALAAAGGAVSLDWQSGPAELLIRWSERAAPAARPALVTPVKPERNGFGMRLIDLCVRQLSGTITMGEEDGGVRRIALTLPMNGVENQRADQIR